MIAQLAGCSVSTVSKAFSGSKEISVATQERIFTIAKEHGIFDKYYKDKFHKRVIAVICPEIISNYYSVLISILNREIESRGCVMALSLSNFEENRIEELFTYYSSYNNVDGIFVIGTAPALKNPTRIPAVILGKSTPVENFDIITINFETAIDNAIEYLKSQGHTRIGFGGEKLTKPKQDKFEKAIRKALLPLDKKHIKCSDRRFEDAGVDLANQWLAQKEFPTAILVAYDYIAIGLMKTLKENGIHIPEDISIIGMDDIGIDPYLEVPLSTIRIHHTKMCRLAIDLIMKKMENPYYHTNQVITIETEFIPRNSSGTAKS